MSIIRDFLLWLEEHQIGVLTTIVVHLLIVSAVLILKIRTNAAREYSIMIDVSQIDMDIEELISQENTQSSANTQYSWQEYNVRHIPVNTSDDRAVESIDQMVRELMAEENIEDRTPPQDIPAETIVRETTLDENDARIYDDRFPLNDSGERTIYRGATTVSYELAGRRHTWMPTPVYRCRAGGTIVVNITVNANGYVLTAEINRSRSDSEDQCLVDAARRDAERSRFNESTQARQQGTITYLFQPQ